MLFKTSTVAIASKFLFGEWPVNHTLRCFNTNYRNFFKSIDNIVIRKMKKFDKDTKPINVIEILMQSDVY